MAHANHDWPQVHGHCVPCLLEELQAAKRRIEEMKPVLEAAVYFWASDKGDTKREAILFEAVEAHERRDAMRINNPQNYEVR